MIKFETYSIPVNGKFTSSLSVVRGSAPCLSTCDSINVSIAHENKQKEFKHVIETVSCLDPKLEKDLAFINFYRKVTSTNGIEEINTLFEKELQRLHRLYYQSKFVLPPLSIFEIADIQSL